MRNAAPTVIALSATLNAGIRPLCVMKQQEVDHLAEHQTIDEIAQGAPRISARPALYSVLPPRRNSATMKTAAAQAMPASTQRCQPEAVARKLNAAPVLYVSTSVNQPVTGGRRHRATRRRLRLS
jgi:hypothetical protein